MCRICVFAGTSEGRRLIERLSGRGAEITACVATEYGEELLGRHEDVAVHAARLDEAEMEKLLRDGRFDVVVDATHPYADRATENIAAACGQTGTEYLRLLRGSSAGVEDGVFVQDARACAEYLQGTQGAILLTTGSKELPAFCADESLRARIYARVLPMVSSLQICAECGIATDHILAMQGPFDEELNLALLRAVDAKFLVTKDTGMAGGYEAKIRAALRAGAQPVIIGRPRQREGGGLEEILRELQRRLGLRPMRKKVVLAGIGMGDADTRTLGLEVTIREADCLIGARRMLEAVDTAGKQTFTAFAAKEIARFVRENDACARFVVLLSGDTGFYSGAKGLVEELWDVETEVLPGISSLQSFCARLKRPWEDVRAVSLHGRACDLEREVRENSAVFMLVGGEDGARAALQRLCAAGMGDLPAHVGEQIGYPNERVSHGTVQKLAEGTYASLSVVLVENPYSADVVATHGLPDEAFERDETPMTKSEVRSISLSKLRLTRGAIVYDIGSGSGSVSVEVAMQADRGYVYAIEMKEKAASLTRRNAEKFHLGNLEVVQGRAPEALEELPAPTHAFIGGSAGSLRGIVDCLLRKNPRVRIVANAVTMESLAELTEISAEFEFCDVAEVSVAKPRTLGRYRLMTAQNPVYIFTMQNGEGGTKTC